jgi:signal transduction histidine kinase
MQDLRLGDVDKRVANYLVGLQAGYGDVYAGIDCRTEDGLVVASSGASRIGRNLGRMAAAGVSIDARMEAGAARLSLPGTATLDDRTPITIETDIPQVYADPGAPPTRLHLDFNAAQISRVLDAASFGHRVIVVVDAQGRWVAGSAALRGRTMPDPAGRLAGLGLARSTTTGTNRETPWMDAPAMLGRAHSLATSTFPGSGWTTLVFEPVDEALAPITEMAKIFAGLLVAVLLATLLASTWIAAAISRPIVTLTAMTRRYREGDWGPAEEPAHSRIVELEVLGRAYGDMVQSVEDSRRELIRTSKMAMLGELAAVLAHEVRTPLGILRSSAQILMRDPGLGPEGLELMGFIESETERLNRLVSTMLDTARPRSPTVAPCDIHVLLRRCAQMHDLRRGSEGASHPVVLELASAEPLIDIDGEQLMQVVFNLLSNATQAAGPAGSVKLATYDGADCLCIECADNGAGIPPELIDKIFDPFVTGRAGGFGLGLAVARQVIVAHDGDIAAGRSAWGGAAFTIRLRRTQAVALQGVHR